MLAFSRHGMQLGANNTISILVCPPQLEKFPLRISRAFNTPIIPIPRSTKPPSLPHHFPHHGILKIGPSSPLPGFPHTTSALGSIPAANVMTTQKSVLLLVSTGLSGSS